MSKQQKGLFIDCGGHIGESIMHFKETDIYKNMRWDIHTFEPHEELTQRMMCKDDENVTLHKVAVWTENGTIDFFTTEGRSNYYGIEDVPWGSSTVMKEKKSGRISTDRKDVVPCIDISDFVNKSADQYDTIILKMDIEGAEYDVLEHMFDTGSINKIDALLIEYHFKKMEISLWRHLKLKYRLKKLNIQIIEQGKRNLSGSWFTPLSEARLKKQ